MRIRLQRSLGLSAIALALGLPGLAALAQHNPEPLLPSAYDQPSAHGRRASERAASSLAGPPGKPAISAPLTTGIPLSSAIVPPLADAASGSILTGLPMGITSFAQLEALPPDKIDELLGLMPGNDIPPAARRSLKQSGLIDSNEGGMPPFSLDHQDAALVRALLAGNDGRLVSRWGHILLRRVLASRLDAPDSMDGAEFVAQRAALLVRMGEGDAARAVVQDVDPANYSPELAQAALDAYAATEDFTGICPVEALVQGSLKTPQWQVASAMCQVFSGNGAGGFHQLDHLTNQGAMPHVDMLLAEKYTGAAGVAGNGARRAVTIEWDDVSDMTPWRYGLTLAVGLNPPASLMQGLDVRYGAASALAPALGLGARADASDTAAGLGVLSATAMVDLYSQIYDDDAANGAVADRALALRDAYLADNPDARFTAMKSLWDGATVPLQRYSRDVLTAYAAARLPVTTGVAGDSGEIIASMLTAGLDANALRWASVVDPGSQGWALLQLAAPQMTGDIGSGVLEHYAKQDTSDHTRKTTFLVAGLAGLSRISDSTRHSMANRLGVDMDGTSPWTRTIDQAAMVNNPTMVALLACLGMQGDGWDKMTPRYLYHIVHALNRVGLSGEARMIAAEAVARA